MGSQPTIVFLTDIGDYANVMKAVIQTMNPDVQFMDLTNNIQPQNIIEGAWMLYNNYYYFPKGSIFLCIVDPGVGSKRPGIIIHTKDYVFIGPDNGLMWNAAHDNGILRTFLIDEQRANTLGRAIFLRKYKASKTFHGRDIFAVTAASLVNKFNMQFLGEFTHVKEKLIVEPQLTRGMVVSIDLFGNIITNIQNPLLFKAQEAGEKGQPQTVTLQWNEKTITIPLYSHYAMAKADELFAVISSNNTLEIAKNQASAQEVLQLTVGMPIVLEKINNELLFKKTKKKQPQPKKQKQNTARKKEPHKSAQTKASKNSEKKQHHRA